MMENIELKKLKELCAGLDGMIEFGHRVLIQMSEGTDADGLTEALDRRNQLFEQIREKWGDRVLEMSPTGTNEEVERLVEHARVCIQTVIGHNELLGRLGGALKDELGQKVSQAEHSMRLTKTYYPRRLPPQTGRHVETLG